MSIYTDTKLLLRGDGVDGSTDIRDSSLYQHEITVNGNAQISTTQSKFGMGSIYLNGNGDYLQGEDAINFGVSPTIISFWGKILNSGSTSAANGSILFGRSSGFFDFYFKPYTGTIRFVYHDSDLVMQADYSFNVTDISNWNYYTLLRDGSNIDLYKNGIICSKSISTAITSDVSISTYDNWIIGRYQFDGTILEQLNGYIEEFQIITGDAVSQIDPTVVPTVPFSYNEYMPYKDLMEGCVAYWDFRDGNLYDVIGNKQLTPVNTPTLTNDHFGLEKNAYAFDGLNTYFKNLNFPYLSSYTIFMIFYPKTEDSNGGGIVSKGSLDGTEYGDFDIIWINSKISFLVNHHSPVNTLYSDILPLNTWHCVAVTFDGLTKQIFVNGNLSNSMEFNYVQTNDESILNIGNYWGYTTYGFDGYISNVIVYDRVLSDSEVKQLTELLQKRYIYPTQQAEMQE